MSNKKIYDFLRDLTANNSKEWMDENRKRYHEAKDIWLEQIAQILKRLEKYDERMASIKPKDTIMRINNNRRFQPNLPVYKDNFGFSPVGMSEPSFYIHISPSGSFIGGGLYRPDKETLKKIREAIDYDGEKLLEITQQSSFTSYYGGIGEDQEMLKTSPRGYSEDNKNIELLRRKSFTAIRNITPKEVASKDFLDLVEEGYKELIPFNAYLKQAVEFTT
ncbi:DUF2461 domain-containing protein [Portibacter lacus]|uniref:TIGR02453 family protein n=1 Tax=Portibacter lacus TaxID=1099794 RepID=A0AA37SPC4_9BACT|nr:DUF2461 domain-containing protein [Portibacter lacus]GLR17552.1 TIGR02453 family protein [Portibacter lacus]